MHILRKHKQGVLIAIILFIGIPMLFFGLPSLRGGNVQPGMAVISKVGDIPVLESEFRQRLDDAAKQVSSGERPTNRELLAMGVIEDVLEGLEDQALVRQEAQQRNFVVNSDFLQQMIKQDPFFKDENGDFSSTLFNAWVKSNEKQGTNWKEIYGSMNVDLARDIYINQALAPAARILDDDIDKELEARFTELTLRFVEVEVDPTDEQMQEFYTNNPDNYRYPAKRKAEYIVLSLTPETSEEAEEVLARAKAGEDFAALAAEVSDMSIDTEGDMGWITKPDSDTDARNTLFELAPGEISGLVRSSEGFFIFKNEEERMSTPLVETEEAEREIHGRRILITASLSEEERQAQIDLAQSIFDTVTGEEEVEFKDAADGLTIQTTDLFSSSDSDIEGIESADTSAFIQAVSPLDEGEFATPVQTPRNIYVARVTEVVEGDVMPFEEAKDKVRRNTITSLRTDEEYQAKVTARAEEIVENYDSLDAAKADDDSLVIGETTPFSVKSTSIVSNIFVFPNEMYQLFHDEEPGALKGPVQNLLSDTYVLELGSKTLPSEETKATAEWTEERELVRQNMTQMAENNYLSDYLTLLRQNKLGPVYDFRRYEGTLAEVLGLNQPEEEEEETATSEVEEPTTENTDETPAEESGDETEDASSDEAPAVEQGDGTEDASSDEASAEE